MKRILIITNSDSVNLKGFQISVGALYQALYGTCISGLPMLLSHDASQLIGWSRSFALYFEPGLTRLTNIGDIGDTNEDFGLLRRLFSHFIRSHLDEFAPEIEQLRNMLQNNLQGQEKRIFSDCLAFVEPDLAKRTFPKLFDLEDDDGLIPIENLKPIGSGVYQIGDLAVFAHPYFRRALFRLNTLDYPLLNALQGLPSHSTRIALDPDMVGLAGTYQGEREELAYWWGPKFNDDLTSIPKGVTHHEADDDQKVMHGIASTEFRWGAMDEYHVFEAEEVCHVSDSEDGNEKFGCRYVHSMVEKENGIIEHLDGAIRMYSRDAMLERQCQDLAHAPRNTEYTKLWRVDGKITVSAWKQLISDYFRDNFLVGEYLGAEPLDKSIWSNKKESTLEDSFIPFSLRKDMGLRLALSLHSRTTEASTPVRVVKPFDVISVGDEKYPYVETFTLELRKALLRAGADLLIPEGVRFVSHKDFYINLPAIYHPEDDTRNSVIQTLEAIKAIVNALCNKSDKWVVSYTIAFPIDQDREVRISTIGQANVLANWLDNPLSIPPVSNSELLDWSEIVANYLRTTYQPNVDKPRIFSILQTSGILLISRKRIEAKNCKFRFSDDTKTFGFELLFDQEGQKLANDLLAIGIQPSMGYLIEESKCTRCGRPYSDCECSKILDQDVAQEILKALPFLYWIDRPL